MALPDMVGMVVADMAAALRFYRLIGLDIPPDVETQDHVEVITPNGYRLAWDTEALVRSFNPAWQPPTGSRVGLAFKCANAAEVDLLYAAVIAAGYRGATPPWDAFWGQRYAVVEDADGNHVDLFAAL